MAALWKGPDMSVPLSRRQLSGMEYVNTALVLASDMLTFTNSLPKRLQYRIAQPMFLESLHLVESVSCANRVYVRDRETFTQRRGYLIDALGHLDTLAAYLDIYWSHFVRTHRPPKEASDEEMMKHDAMISKTERRYLAFGRRISDERKLVHGVISRDKKAYEKQVAG